MLSRSKIHLFTSCKGSAGQTTHSISLLRGYINLLNNPSNVNFIGTPDEVLRELPIVGFDLNNKHTDLYKEARKHRSPSDESPLAIEYPHDICNETGQSRTLANVFQLMPGLGNTSGGYIYRRQEDSTLYLSSMFWKYIVSLTYFHKRHHHIQYSRNELFLVVDTGNSPESLLGVVNIGDSNRVDNEDFEEIEDTYNEMNKTIQELVCLNRIFDIEIYIWFIWTGNVLGDTEFRDKVVSSLISLREIPMNIRVMHVLTPIAYLPEVQRTVWLAKLGRASRSYYPIRPLCELATLPRSQHSIEFNDFFNLVSQDIKRLSPGQGNYEDIFVDLTKRIKDSSKGRPYNLIVIPYFFRALHGSIEGFKDSSNRAEVDSIISTIGDLLIQYLRCGQGESIKLPYRC